MRKVLYPKGAFDGQSAADDYRSQMNFMTLRTVGVAYRCGSIQEFRQVMSDCFVCCS